MTRLGASEAQAQLLTGIIDDLAGKLSPRLLLDHVLRGSLLLLGCNAGSVCTVDERAGIYRKEADIGVGCQSGRVFPLSEGVTGAVVAAGGPVLVDDYDQIPGGHLGPADRTAVRSAVGVPFTWHGRVVGSCVLFGPACGGGFVDADAALLEQFASHVGVAIANTGLCREAEGRAPSRAGSSDGVYRDGVMPLTAREKEVRRLLEQALTDKEIAAELQISAKTVEKHVGAILRKSGLRSRTELVARAGGLIPG